MLSSSSTPDALMARLELAVDGFIDDTDLDDECRRQLYDVEYEVRNNFFYCLLYCLLG